jgi:hypothetical protein
MNQKDDEGTEREQISPSAVYHQLADHLGPDEAPYDAGAGLERLLGWMGAQAPPDEDRQPAGQGLRPEQRVQPAVPSEAELELTRMRLEAVERLAEKTRSDSRIALGAIVLVSVLAGLGLLFRLSHVPAQIALPVLAAVGAIDGLLTLAVAVLYRTTMKGLHDDLRLAFGEPAEPVQSPDRSGKATSQPVAPRMRSRPLVVRFRAGTYPPLLQFLVTIAFLGFAAACVLAYATHSLLPFTVTCIVVAGLFLILVLPVVISAIWAGELRRNAAGSILDLMLARGRVPPDQHGQQPGPLPVARGRQRPVARLPV